MKCLYVPPAYDMRTLTYVCRWCPVPKTDAPTLYNNADSLRKHTSTCPTCTASPKFNPVKYAALITNGATAPVNLGKYAQV